jgi:hypothetical protein
MPRRFTNVDPLIPLVLVLVVVCYFLWARVHTEYREYKAAAVSLEARGQRLPYVPSLMSYSITGDRVLQTAASGTHIYAVVGLTRQDERQDVEMWRDVAAVINDPRVVLFACCADQGCASRLNHDAAGSLLIVSDVPYLLGRAVAMAASRRRVLLLDRTLTIIDEVEVGHRQAIVTAISEALRRVQ